MKLNIKNFTISKNNIISVRAAKVVWYLRDIMRKYLSQSDRGNLPRWTWDIHSLVFTDILIN